MAPIRLWPASVLIAVGTLTGCTQDESPSEACGEALSAPAGELRTVTSASSLGADALILGSAALPDGGVIVAYDANPEEVGGEELGTGPGPLAPAGGPSCDPFPLPTVDDSRVGSDAQPVAVGPDGQLYLWDGAEDRVVRGIVGKTWETVVEVPPDDLEYELWPGMAIGAGGEVFVATDYRISAAAGDGTLATVAGTGAQGRTAEAGTGNLPRPGTSKPLPEVRAIRSAPSGAIVLAAKFAVMELDGGTMTFLVDEHSTAAEEGALIERTGLTALAVTASGDVLASDLPQKRIIRISDGRSTVLLEAGSYLSLSPGHALFADDAGLLVHEDGGQGLAVYGLPDSPGFQPIGPPGMAKGPHRMWWGPFV